MVGDLGDMTLIADRQPRQGFGCMRLRDDSHDDSDRNPAAVINGALDAGITLLDTADAYGNEALVGRAIRTRREEVVLCSKFGLVWGEGGDWSVRAEPAYVRQACEASLRRLDVDVIDLYYLHHRSESTPIEHTVTAMAELVEAGKVRALGLSNISADDLRRAHAVHPITAVQEEWSLVQREVEQMLPVLIELGITVVAHSPTGHGLLHAPEAGATDTAHAALRAALSEIAELHDATPGQVSLAWVHHRSQRWGLRVLPLPGTASLRHLHVNIAAADLSLPAIHLDRLDAVSDAVR